MRIHTTSKALLKKGSLTFHWVDDLHIFNEIPCAVPTAVTEWYSSHETHIH